jgi:prophage regulatory protein
VSNEMSDNTGATTRMLRFREVHARTQLSRVTIWRMERRREFPARRQLSANAVGWIEREVEEWLSTRRTARCLPVDPVNESTQRRAGREEHRDGRRSRPRPR